jgi:hypothetical protein
VPASFLHWLHDDVRQFDGTLASRNYSGQHKRTVVDIETPERDANKIKHYCRIHREETIMKATETVLGTEP